MLPDGIQLHRLSPADAVRVRALMYRIYPSAYEYLWQDGGRWYLEQMYTVEGLRAELADPTAHCWIITALGEEQGFLKLIEQSQPGEEDGRGLYLQRLYLLPAARGRGLGHQLMQFTFEWARQHGCTYVWLEAMEVSRARNFYARYGFEARGCRRLDFPGMHDEMRGLLLMRAALPQLHPQEMEL